MIRNWGKTKTYKKVERGQRGWYAHCGKVAVAEVLMKRWLEILTVPVNWKEIPPNVSEEMLGATVVYDPTEVDERQGQKGFAQGLLDSMGTCMILRGNLIVALKSRGKVNAATYWEAPNQSQLLALPSGSYKFDV